MKAKDHMHMARTLADTYSLRGKKRKAFLLGNIIPDINVFTYLTPHRGDFLKGHSYRYKRRLMQRMMHARATGSMRWWYRTGKLCHYLSDSFTGAHDLTRRVPLSRHKAYEHHLHAIFQQRWKPLAVKPAVVEANGHTATPGDRIADMRREYERYNHSMERDCRMIVEAVRTTMASMTEAVHKRRLERMQQMRQH